MKAVVNGVGKWITSYVLVVFAIMIMPVFLVTNDVGTFESMVNYIFDN